MTAEEENQILLFRSGELDPEEAGNVEALLAGDAEAARFLAELERQARLARPEPDADPLPRSFAAAAAETVAAERRKIARFPSFRAVSAIGAIAAALAVLAVAFLSLRDQPRPDSPGMTEEISRREAIEIQVSDLEAAMADFQRTAGFARRRT